MYDPDLRQFQGEQALEGIASREKVAAERGLPKTPSLKMRVPRQPLFIPDEDEDGDDAFDYTTDEEVQELETKQVYNAVQASLEDLEAEQMRQAIEESRKLSSAKTYLPTTPGRAGPSRTLLDHREDDDLYMQYTPSRLDTALRFANTSRDHDNNMQITPPKSSDIRRNPFSGSRPLPMPEVASWSTSDGEDDMEEIMPAGHTLLDRGEAQTIGLGKAKLHALDRDATIVKQKDLANQDREEILRVEDSSDDMEEVMPNAVRPLTKQAVTVDMTKSPTASPPITGARVLTHSSASTVAFELRDTQMKLHKPASSQPTSLVPERHITPDIAFDETSTPSQRRPEVTTNIEDAATRRFQDVPETLRQDDDLSDDEAWPKASEAEHIADNEAAHHDEEFDAANEIDVHEEEGEFARFAAQVKGKDLDSVRRELDDEIRQLHQQRKAAMRDSEDVTQNMIAQVMVRLSFHGGLPTVTYAQC